MAHVTVKNYWIRNCSPVVSCEHTEQRTNERCIHFLQSTENIRRAYQSVLYLHAPSLFARHECRPRRAGFLAMSSSVRLSVCRPSSVVCLSSVVCNVRAPYSGNWNFRQCFYAIWYLGICDPSIKILRRSSQGNPSVGGLNQRGVDLGNGERQEVSYY